MYKIRYTYTCTYTFTHTRTHTENNMYDCGGPLRRTKDFVFFLALLFPRDLGVTLGAVLYPGSSCVAYRGDSRWHSAAPVCIGRRGEVHACIHTYIPTYIHT